MARPGVRRPGDLTVAAVWRGVVTLWPRLAITLICLAFWRILAAVPLPVAGLTDLRLASGQLSPVGGLLALFLGQPLEQESVVAMALSPFLDAFVIFWLWTVATGNWRTAQSDEPRMWRILAWLTAGLAFFRAFGLTMLFVRGHAAALTSTAGLLSIFGLLFGTMALFGLGRVIDRFGEPAGYGVWFLFGVHNLVEGTHGVARWVAADSGDSAMPAIMVASAVVSVMLVASAFLVIQAARKVSVQAGSKGRAAKDRIVSVHMLGGGVILPIVLANFAVSFIPTMVMEIVLRLSGQQALTYWSGLSPLPLVVIGYHVTFFIALVLACFFTTARAVDPTWLTHRYLKRVSTSLTLAGGVWMALVVAVVPLASLLALGPSRARLPVGGGPFVIGAAILITAAQRLRRQNADGSVTAS
jgi:preprotein translocase subunit SecY